MGAAMRGNLRRKIVFVIGAGASADFGFPVGEQLANQIQNRLDMEFHNSRGDSKSGTIKASLEQIGISDYEDAIRQLRAGIGPGESIDQFLFRRRTNRKVRDLGMMTLADVILEAERKSPLMQFNIDNFEASLNAQRVTNGSWPAIVLDAIIGIRSPDEISKTIFSDIGFAIFNYDRCVEHSLFHHLYLRHDLPLSRAEDIVRSITILHVYGVLGDLWDGALPFGAESTSLASLAGLLRTYHEELDDVEHEQSLRELLDNAEKVVFLGFGSHPNNLQLLFPKYDFHNAQLWGTTKGCASSDTFSKISSVEGSTFEDINCAAFIRRFGADILYGNG